MSTQDDQSVRAMAPNTQVSAAEADSMANDMRAILKLIATQLEDTDRRQSEVLGDMRRRLAEMSKSAQLTSARVPMAFAPAFERIQEGIEQLAELVSAADAHASDAFAEQAVRPVLESNDQELSGENAGWDEPDHDVENGDTSLDADGHWTGGMEEPESYEAPVSNLFPRRERSSALFDAPMEQEFVEKNEAEDSDPDLDADDMMITDNAADRIDIEEPADQDASRLADEFDADDVEEKSSEAAARTEPPVFATSDFGLEDDGLEKSELEEDAAWDREQAEALTRVYEDHHAEEAAMAAGGSSYSAIFSNVPDYPQRRSPAFFNEEPSQKDMHAEAEPAAPSLLEEPEFEQAKFASAARGFDPTDAQFADGRDDCEPDVATDFESGATPGQEEVEMLPQPSESRNFHRAADGNANPAIEQAWLEERFAEIAAKIEESIFELRDDQALASLSNRFGEFEERIGLALEDVATRHDVDALKSAEAQIDSMVGYFERVEAQLGRIDSLEGQMQALLEKFSDDNLMQHFAGQGGASDADYSGIAEAAAESVAQRFLADFANGAIGGQGEQAAIGDMREALEAFIAERRERDDEAAGMMDTIQQALIRVLDRVEVLESGTDNPPMSSPDDDEFISNGTVDDSDEFGPHDEFAAREEFGAGDEFAEDAFDGADEFRSQADQSFDDLPQRGRRPAPDFAQTRLEYPAVVRERPEAEQPRAEPDFDDGLVDAEHQNDVEAFNDDAFNDVAEPLSRNEDQAHVSEHNDESHGYSAEQLTGEQQTWNEPEVASGEGQPAVSPIDRLRQEFIADARRAREHASQQAMMVGSEAKPAVEEPAKKRLSLPSLSALGAKVRGKSAPKSEEAAPAASELAAPEPAASAAKAPGRTSAARVNVVTNDEPEPSSSRFAMPRSRMLVGAVIVLFATAGALLMMRSPSQPIVDAPAAIERSIDIPGQGPELSGPEEMAPAIESDQPHDRRGSLEGGKVYDGEFNYDVPAGSSPGPLAEGLAGVAVADLDKAPDPAILAKARRQQHLAKMSSELGAAAAYATPANLVAEQPATETAPVAGGSVASKSHGNHLDLPPATVGPLSLRLAAAKGDPSAQFEVAARLAGGTGTQQDLSAAMKWYKLAAAQGFAQAQYRLGTLYERGLGVEKDLARSAIWYERAAAKGNVKAMHNLAVVTAGRKVGGPDYQTAAKWFGAAAEYGLSDSQFNMAVLCENGLGVEKDLARAYVYYSLAASKGDTQAKARRDAVRQMLSDSAREDAERRVSSFRPKTSDRLVNDARVAGEDWKKRADGGY